MAAPTNHLCDVNILLANPEPSTHGPSATSLNVPYFVVIGGEADIAQTSLVGRK